LIIYFKGEFVSEVIKKGMRKYCLSY